MIWSTVASLFLSAVAISISIFISSKQNKIALFEHRFNVFNILSFLLSTTKSVVSNSRQENADFDTWEILAEAMQTYKYSSSPFDENINFSKLDYFYTHLLLSAVKVSLLFKKVNTKTVILFLETVSSLVSNVSKDQPFDNEIALLGDLIEKIEKEKTMEKLEKFLKL